MTGALQMYDLAGRDDNLRFSPFCWRSRFAIAHKRLRLEANLRQSGP